MRNKKHHKAGIVFLMVFVTFATGCAKSSDKGAANEGIPEIEQKILSFSLSNYGDDGSKKWVLNGDSANVLSDVIYLTNMLADTYEEPQMKLTSDEGSYDRKSRIIRLTKNVVLTTSDGLKLTTDSVKWDGETNIISTTKPVRIKRSDVVATGLGAKALPYMKKIMLNKDVKVMLLNDAMGGASLTPQKTQPIESGEFKVTITCDGPLEIDYENNIAIFKDNVKVDDQRGQIYAGRMDAYLDPVSKSIVKVIAEGGVKVVRDKDSTFSDRAIYTTADQKIVLLGKPKIFIHADEEIEKVEQAIGKKKKW